MLTLPVRYNNTTLPMRDDDLFGTVVIVPNVVWYHETDRCMVIRTTDNVYLYRNGILS